MRTSAMRWPSTSKRRALPGASSSRRHNVTRSPTTVLQLVDNGAAQTLREGTDRQPVEHIVEEPEHDQALRFFGLDAARFEVVALVVVDRADRRRMRAPHVVRFDFEIRDRLGA